MLKEHKIIVLQFSGGKDSIALLHLMRPYWDRLTVMWCNTGDAFPETIKQMQEVAATVPNFVEVKGNQPGNNREHGYPSDLVPAWDTPLGRQLHAGRTYKVQTPMSCCGSNLWEPMAKAVRAMQATLVIRGQRNEEAIKSPIRSGYVDPADGVEYLFPLEDWSFATLVNYLNEHKLAMPEHYVLMKTSLDCQHCTAYLGENRGKMHYMRARHPALYREVVARLTHNVNAQHQEMSHALAIIDESME